MSPLVFFRKHAGGINPPATAGSLRGIGDESDS